VAYENYRSLLRSNNAPSDGNIVFQRHRLILDNTDAIAILLEDVVDALPAGAVHEATVDENDGR
jgi:hypothetical protein